MENAVKRDKIELFEKMPVSKAVSRLVVPTIISQLISMIYNLADTYFVGQTGDYNQVAAITLVFPAYMTLGAIANLLGIGGGSLVSRSLGKKDYTKARQAACFSFYAAIAVTFVYSLFSLIFPNVFLKFSARPRQPTVLPTTTCSGC
ncbi:MAG TPA: MATE family efflux transporter [Clostridia bacterium]|nr:MATE family efflux transporter [Clostridia bacterium]